MTERKESLTVKLEKGNGDYMAVLTEFDDGNGAIEKNDKKENLQTSHMENVLNHYGEKGWILENISPDEKTLQFSREKKGLISKVFGHRSIRHRIRNIYKDKKTNLFEVGADTPFGEISSTQDLYLGSIEEVISYISKQYGYALSVQGAEIDLTDSVLIRLYFHD